MHESIEYYDKILYIDLSDVNALNNKAIALQTLKRYNETIEYIDKPLIDPSNVTCTK